MQVDLTSTLLLVRLLLYILKAIVLVSDFLPRPAYQWHWIMAARCGQHNTTIMIKSRYLILGKLKTITF